MNTREQLGIQYCPVCRQDTLPHDTTSACLWCDTTLLINGQPVATRYGRPVKWTRETVVAEIQRYARKHGRPPVQREMWAMASTCHQRLGWSFADAVEAAGFPRPIRGRRRAA